MQLLRVSIFMSGLWTRRFESRSRPGMSLSLSSSAFSNGAKIPRRHTCDGVNVSPPLAWSGVPAGTRALVLVCSDPDAPGGTFHHWAAYNIPPDASGLEEGVHDTSIGQNPLQAVNDFGRRGYAGPCPPHGHGPHRYVFRLSSLREPLAGVHAKASCAEIIALAKPHEIAVTELVGVYER